MIVGKAMVWVVVAVWYVELMFELKSALKTWYDTPIVNSVKSGETSRLDHSVSDPYGVVFLLSRTNFLEPLDIFHIIIYYCTSQVVLDI